MSDNNTIKEPLVGREVDLVDLLSTLLTNEALHDLTLKGSDGVEVGCHRAILAARSSVFQGMLFGKFSEASQKTVELGFKGQVLQAVVEYIYTDEPHILNMKKRKNMDNEESWLDMEQVKIILSLVDASNFFHLPALLEKTAKHFSQVLTECSSSALFEVLETLTQAGPTVPGSFMDAAMDRVRYQTHILMSETDILSQMNGSSLEKILCDQQTYLCEEDLFDILQNWVEVNPTERKTAAVELAKCIRLEHIDVVTLNTTVTASGLVSSQQLHEAYKSQAMGLSKNKYCQPRVPVWSNSLSIVSAASTEEEYELDLLKYPPIKSGKHVWKIELLADSEDDESVRFGIATGLQLGSSVPLGNSEGGWAVSDCGLRCDGNDEEHDDFNFNVYPGDIVTLTLNLDPKDPSNGCLEIVSSTLNSGMIVFENLHDHLKIFPEGFVPAVSTCAPGRVRLLEIKTLED